MLTGPWVTDTDDLQERRWNERGLELICRDREWGTKFGAAVIQIEGRSPHLGLPITSSPISVTHMPEMVRGVEG